MHLEKLINKEVLGKGALVVGGLLALHFILREQRKKQPDINYIESLPMGLHAVTIPPLGIYVREDQAGNAALLQHEMIHWQQYQRMGLLPYYWNYLKESVMNGYDLNAMEQEARANESDYCKTNYTDCVRTGQSKTVNDTKFLIG